MTCDCFQVVDTPDFTQSDHFSREGITTEIRRWKDLTSPRHDIILLAVRCDVCYTAEEYHIYKTIKECLSFSDFTQRLVVGFTFGDRQDGDINRELGSVCPELQDVLRDARRHYVVFDSTATPPEKHRQAKDLLAKYGVCQFAVCMNTFW